MREDVDVSAYLADCPVVPLPEIESVRHLMSELRRTSPDFEALMVRYSEPHSAFRHFGLLLWSGGNLDGAVQLLSAALRLSPEDAALWRDLAHVFQALGRQELARTCTLRSLRIDPHSAVSWLLFGDLARASGSRDAEAAFGTAVDLQADLTEAHSRSARY